MEKNLNKSVNDIVCSIIGSLEFKECIRLKEKMDNNTDIKELVESIKKLQKEYVRTSDDSIKDELNILENRLESIPLYASYQRSLSEVNQKIDFIKDELNDYFYNVVNPKE